MIERIKRECQYCDYVKHYPSNEDNNWDTYWCRRNAPTGDSNKEPQVHALYWCGEFEPKSIDWEQGDET